jgi:hypothetical protein
MHADAPGMDPAEQKSPVPHAGTELDEHAPLTIVWPEGQQ